ncbi:transcriptional repressor NrdR [Candidatus Woesearchaeota archaeon]|nr:transcriptional repressor NrdR [Candidatus Woesearchaeota archaeon]
MKCPYCGSPENKVVDKRGTSDEIATRRRRECLACEKRFTTYERIESVELLVIKKDGSRQQFDRNKIKHGIVRACEKRPISADQINRVVDEIESELRTKETTEISSAEIGEIVMNKLRDMDKIAYIRFASVYREFTDLKSFEKELKNLLSKRGGEHHG